MMESRNNQIAIAVALILLLGTVVVYFSLGPSVTVDVLPSGENELISLAQESGRLNIFVDDEIYDESFFNYIDNEFSTKYGIDVEITTGHWSGIQTSLINEKVSGRNSGSFDLVILNDEATARLIEKKLTFSQTGSLISSISEKPITEDVIKPKIAGVDNDGSGITLWFDVYSYMYNSEEFYKFENVYCYLGLVGEDDDDDDDGSGSGDDDDDEDRCPTAEDHDDDDDNNDDDVDTVDNDIEGNYATICCSAEKTLSASPLSFPELKPGFPEVEHPTPYFLAGWPAGRAANWTKRRLERIGFLRGRLKFRDSYIPLKEIQRESRRSEGGAISGICDFP